MARSMVFIFGAMAGFTLTLLGIYFDGFIAGVAALLLIGLSIPIFDFIDKKAAKKIKKSVVKVVTFRGE